MFNKKLTNLLIIAIIIILIFILIIFNFLKLNLKESFETQDILLKKANDEIENDENKWLIFNADKDVSGKYILKGINSNYSAEIKNNISNNDGGENPTEHPTEHLTGHLPKITINEVINKNENKNKNENEIIKFTGTDGTQNNKNEPSLTGTFNNTEVDIKYSLGEKRFIININKGETIIIGHGGFSNGTYPPPWDKITPILYKEGGSLIAVMAYKDDIKDIDEDTTYLPMEILVSKDYEKYIPLFFEVYVLSQENIKNL